jgi:hypothetical protein
MKTLSQAERAVTELRARGFDTEGRIKGANILISVHIVDAHQREMAKDVLEKVGGEDIRTQHGRMEATWLARRTQSRR